MPLGQNYAIILIINIASSSYIYVIFQQHKEAIMAKVISLTKLSELVLELSAGKKQIAVDSLLAKIEELKVQEYQVQNPPKVIDGVQHYYCRFHAKYEPVEDMVMSNNKSKGYCKAAISVWNKMYGEINKLGGQIMQDILASKYEEAKAKGEQQQALKLKLNSVNSYDYERDWAEFKKNNSK